MATLNQPKQYQQSEIDRHNRYLTRFNQMQNPSQADRDTVGQIQKLYGDNFNQQGINPQSWSGQSQQNYLLANPYQAQQQATQQYNQNVQNTQQQYQNSQARADANKWNSATIQDIASKYGFDYSRDYAKQQAEAEAQARRNANADAQRRNVSNRDQNLMSIDNNLLNQAEALDRNYFQQGLAQMQNQTNTGINAGIASDQDLRLQMNRQAEMASSYRDANLGRMSENNRFSNEDLRLAEDLGLINQQSLAREDSLYNDRLMQGYGQLMAEREMMNSLDQQEWGRNQTELDRLMNVWNTNLNQGNLQSQDAFNRFQQGLDNTFRDQQFSWQQAIDRANQLGMFEGQRNMAGQQFDWGKQMDEIANQQWEKEFNENVRQFGLEYALKQQQLALSRASMSTGRSGGGGTGAPVSAPAQNLAQKFQNYQATANSQARTFEDRFYQAKENAIDKLIPAILPANAKAKANIKAPTTIDRALDLFKR